MTTRSLVAALAVASSLLPGCAKRAAAPAPAAAAATHTAVEDLPALLPDVDLSALTDEQREIVARFLDDQFCYCGCPHTVAGCLRGHAACPHAKRMAWLAARLASAGLAEADVVNLVTEYYASFETTKRSKLEVKDFGPPLGDAAAPITLVEFSDFTCPFCQMLRPQLEKWVEANAGRVKLIYKPFPIDSHPHSYEAAQAGEWAREQGIFWQMHDLLFSHPGAHAPEELAGYARELGADGDALVAAIDASRYLPRIQASRAEARAAGITGTPTLYFNGRRMVVTDFSTLMLDRTLADEEEWQAHHGWAKD